MAASGKQFSAAIGKWATATEQRMEAVFRESTQRAIVEMTTPQAKSGPMPVRTGYLRNSVVVSTDGPAPIRADAKPEAGQTYAQSGEISGPTALVIAGAKLGQTIWACFTAAYAARVNYGFHGTDSLGREYNTSGAQFVGLTAQRWPKIVSEVVRDLKAYVKSNAKGSP